MGFYVRANEINKYANYLLTDVLNDLYSIKWEFPGNALSTEGIEGRIRTAIDPFIDGVEGMVDDVFEKGLIERLVNLADALKATALEYGEIDEAAEREFKEQRQHGDKRPTGNKRFPRM